MAEKKKTIRKKREVISLEPDEEMVIVEVPTYTSVRGPIQAALNAVGKDWDGVEQSLVIALREARRLKGN